MSLSLFSVDIAADVPHDEGNKGNNFLSIAIIGLPSGHVDIDVDVDVDVDVDLDVVIENVHGTLLNSGDEQSLKSVINGRSRVTLLCRSD